MEETRGATGPKTFERQVSAGDVDAIVAATHGDPFAVLGIQDVGGQLVARCFIPNAESMTAFTLGGEEVGKLTLIHEAGFFEGPLSIAQPQPNRNPPPTAGGVGTDIDR
jgi:1,4-alpha-glucan branching enzyme